MLIFEYLSIKNHRNAPSNKVKSINIKRKRFNNVLFFNAMKEPKSI